MDWSYWSGYTYLTAQVYLVYILIRHSHRKSNNLKVKSCISFCLYYLYDLIGDWNVRQRQGNAWLKENFSKIFYLKWIILFWLMAFSNSLRKFDLRVDIKYWHGEMMSAITNVKVIGWSTIWNVLLLCFPFTKSLTLSTPSSYFHINGIYASHSVFVDILHVVITVAYYENGSE